MRKSFLLAISLGVVCEFAVSGENSTEPHKIEQSVIAVSSSPVRNLQAIEDIVSKFKGSSNSLDTIAFGAREHFDAIRNSGAAATPQVMKVLGNKTKDWRVRYLLALEIIPRTKDKATAMELQTILKDKTEHLMVRSAVASGVGAIGGKDAVKTLKNVANEHIDSQEFQASIIRALADAGDREGVPLLTKRLAHKDHYIKVVAVRALHKIAKNTKDPSVVAPLRALLADKNFEHRNVAINLLGDLQDKRAMDKLISCMKDANEDYVVRCSAAEAIGKIGGGEADVALMGILNDKDELLRGYASVGLAKGKRSHEKISALQKAFQTTNDKYIRAKISKSIRRLETGEEK